MQKLLLLHGALGSEANFIVLKSKLAVDFEVYTLNFKGHGGTTVPDNMTIADFAKEVLAFLDQNHIEKTAIFGYSMGGYVGMYLAKNFPERIIRLFTLATKLNWTVEGAAKEAAMLNPMIIKEKVPKFAENLAFLHGNSWEILMQKTAKMMLQLGANPTLKNEDFPVMVTPILMAVGDKDTMVSIEETTNVYRLLPNAQLLVLPNTSHPIEKVNADELAHQIKKYFL